MPIGSYTAIPYVASEFAERPPRTVLDLGIGFGMYGAVVRQWVDQGVRPWRTRLVGVEAWSEYRSPLWDLYDLIVADRIENYLARYSDLFDAVILSDVLEHFEHDAGEQLLRSAAQRLNPRGRLFVCTPAHFYPQESVYGNDLERHRSLWTPLELANLGFEILLTGQDPQLGYPTIIALYRHESADLTAGNPAGCRSP